MIEKKYINKGIIIIILVLSLVGIFYSRIITNTKLGLDLQGGIEILYSVNPINDEKVDQELIDSTIDVLNRRVNSFGISETVISQEGSNMIRVQVPGVKDQSSAREMLGSSAILSFRDTEDNYLMGSDVLKTGKAKLTNDSTGKYAVKLSVKDPEKMREVTSGLVGQTMTIWLDFEEGIDSYENSKGNCGTEYSNCISAATVQQELSNEAIISGNFTEEEATTLVGLINSGSLQVELNEEYSTSIGASFGDEALQSSILAGIVGLLIVIAFIIVKYNFVGFISSVGLILYTFCVFLIFFILGGVLTLPGIAALILGVGMAIDANVITYERIKDSLRNGEDLKTSFPLGNKDSLLTIIDANITTFIIAIILYIFGQTAIKGFATMLIINICLTFLITVLFTRFLLNIFIKSNYFDNKVNSFIKFKQKNRLESKFKLFNYINKSKIFFSISLVIILGGLTFGKINGFELGIDFTSGSSVVSKLDKSEYKDFDKYMSSKYDVVDSMYVKEKGLGVIRTSDSLDKNQVTEVSDYLKDKFDSEGSIQKVSPTVGRNLIDNSIYSLLIAVVAIVVYITFRFRSTFAFAAIVALLHDLLIMIALFAIIKFTISGNFIAALLAILGYSINDTIVLFDRIRTNINIEIEKITSISSNQKKKRKKKPITSGIIEYSRLKDIVNASVKETIGRSLITSFTTLMPILALIILGASEILEFNVALAIGIVFGTYSSIFIASQIWLLFERKGYNFGKKDDGWFKVESTNEKYVD
ncbi:MAG: protein translocase subunit SecD [Bacilli bacterium]